MTGEIIQSILQVEKKAEQVLANAKNIAQTMAIETTAKINNIQNELKDDKKQLLAKAKEEIDKKADHQTNKIAEKTAKTVAALNEIASKNMNRVQKLIVDKLIS